LDAEDTDEDNTLAIEIAGVAFAVQMRVLSMAWDYLSARLTSMEQTTTQYDFCQSKSIKLFVVGFINAFAKFFYSAFAQEAVDPKSCAVAGGCEALLTENLRIVFASYIAFGILDMLLPLATQKFSIWQEARAMKDKDVRSHRMSFLEMQAKRPKYTDEDSTADFLQLIFPLAFVALFSMVAPSVVILLFVSLCMQFHVDFWKLMLAYQRPFPDTADGIGLWNSAMTGLVWLSTYVNAALIVSRQGLDHFPLPSAFQELQPLAKFLILQSCFVIVKVAVDAVYGDEGKVTLREQARQAHQRRRIFEAETSSFEEDLKLFGTGSMEDAARFDEIPPFAP
jgi:hypothetical protein